METYCVRCKKKPESLNPKFFKTKMIGSLCNQNVLNVDLKIKNKKQKVYWVT